MNQPDQDWKDRNLSARELEALSRGNGVGGFQSELETMDLAVYLRDGGGEPDISHAQMLAYASGKADPVTEEIVSAAMDQDPHFAQIVQDMQRTIRVEALEKSRAKSPWVTFLKV